jgi:hypothetical protein
MKRFFFIFSFSVFYRDYVFFSATLAEKILNDYRKTYKSDPKLSKYEVFFKNIFKGNDVSSDSENVIDYSSWNDIKLFYGTKNNPNYNLIKTINNCETILGEGVLAYNLSTPAKDIQEIKRRQKVIKTIIENEVLFDNICSTINKFKNNEENIFVFFDETSSFSNFEKNEKLIKKFYYEKRNNVNKNLRQMTVRKIFKSDIWNIFMKPYFNGFGLLGYETAYLLAGGIHSFFHVAQFIPIPIFRESVNILGAGFLIKSLKNLAATNITKTVLSGLFFLVGIATSIWSGFKIVKKYKEYKNTIAPLVEQIKALQVMFKTMLELEKIFSEDNQLKELLNNNFLGIKELIKKMQAHNELGFFLRCLENVNFERCNYLSSKNALVLVLYKIFCDHKDEFKQALCEIGGVDMFLSFAKLMKKAEEKNKNIKYCFSEFCNNNNPILKIKELWNPFLGSLKVITNDVSLGEHFTNIIICGHNGGGKSTYLKALFIALLLSQTFGIAPAETIYTSYFKKIIFFSNIEDELADSDSLFMLEFKRLKEYVDMCKTLKKQEFIFSIFDEPMHGTDSDSAVALLKGIFKHLAYNNSKNLLHVISTHYRGIIELEEESSYFKNFIVKIDNDPKTGKIYYLYKIIPGISRKSIAIDIASEKGLDKDILEIVKSEHEKIQNKK